MLSDEEVLQLTSLREIFGAFAHEIAQPLNAIMIAAQVIQLRVQRSSLPEEEKSFLAHRMGIVSSQVQRASGVVEGLRAFSRGLSGRGDQTDVSSLFKEVYRLMGQQFMGRGIEVAWAPLDSLPLVALENSVAERILVQAMAFARDSMDALASWHEEGDIHFKKALDVKFLPESDGSAIIISWGSGELAGGESPLESGDYPGLVAAGNILAARGGKMEIFRNTVVLFFP